MEEKENIFNKFANKLTKNRLVAFNILICMVVVTCIVYGLISLLSYQQPENLQEVTGTVAEFKQRDEQWYDFIGGGGKNSFFDVRFEDGTLYQATGISYDNIDRELFDKLSIGDEITLTYSARWSGPNRIFAIKYNGDNYLLLDDVLTIYEKEAQTSKIKGAVLIPVSLVVGGILLFVANYKYRKKNNQSV